MPVPRSSAAWFHRFGSSPFVYRLAGRLSPWVGGACLLALAAGLWLGLVVAPADYEQGESYRIIYVHVPAAWMSMFVYTVMAVSSAIFLIWRLKLADVVAAASAPIGAGFTVVALVTGSLWGKPMWGTWWVWDGRLTSELLLLFLYLGYMALRGAFEQPRTAEKAAAILAVVGVVNIPIIHFSVEWWNTLHQPATIIRARRAEDAHLEHAVAAADHGGGVPAAVLSTTCCVRRAHRHPASARAARAWVRGARRGPRGRHVAAGRTGTPVGSDDAALDTPAAGPA